LNWTEDRRSWTTAARRSRTGATLLRQEIKPGTMVKAYFEHDG
jgi:hypothetical protein